jgi:citrate lyase subunit beta / citryl-CoA lyase
LRKNFYVWTIKNMKSWFLVGIDECDELERVIKLGCTGIILRKCESGAHVQQLGARLAVLEADNGLAEGATKIIGVIETAKALLHLASFVGKSERLTGFKFDSDALNAMIGVEACGVAKSLVRIAATAVGVEMIDNS